MRDIKSIIESIHGKKRGSGWTLSAQKISQLIVGSGLQPYQNDKSQERKRTKIKEAAEKYLVKLARQGSCDIIHSSNIHRYSIRKIGSSMFEFTFEKKIGAVATVYDLESPPVELRARDRSVMERFLREFIMKKTGDKLVEVSALKLTQELVAKRWISPGRYDLSETELTKNIRYYMVEHLEQLIKESPFEWNFKNETRLLSVEQTNDDLYSFEKVN